MQRRSRKKPEPVVAEVAPSSAQDQQSLALDGNLDLTAAGDLARAFLALRGCDLTLDATAVRHLGAQCAQVLLSAAKTWQADRRRLCLCGVSAEFGEGLRLLGLPSAFEIMEPV